MVRYSSNELKRMGYAEVNGKMIRLDSVSLTKNGPQACYSEIKVGDRMVKRGVKQKPIAPYVIDKTTPADVKNGVYKFDVLPVTPPNNIHIAGSRPVLFIPYNVPSSKNSRDIVTHPTKRYSILIPSKAVRNYKRATKSIWPLYGKVFKKMLTDKEKPYRIQFIFVRSTKATFDFQNAVQILCDLMQEYEWIDNDDIKTMLPVPPDTNPAYLIDKDNPGVYISVL